MIDLKKDSGKELKKVLTKMCSYVGADVDKIDFKKEDWFMDYRWTIEQERDFKRWLTKRLLRNKKTRYTLLRIPTWKDPMRIKNAVEMFAINYGWSYKETENIK